LIHPLLSKAEQQAIGQLAALKTAASSKLKQQSDEAIQRLLALQSVNPLVRPEEIAHLKQQQQEGLAYLEKARLKLDAIRVIIVSHD
jgi:ATP-dependent helicase HepA